MPDSGDPPTAGRKGRILLIEDEPAFRRSVEALLSAEGYEVLTQETGAGGLAAFSEEHPDLVILDLALPDADGLDICQAMKQHPFARHIPVLVMTARKEHESLVHAFDAGADDYLLKPPFLPGLLARVRAHLRGKRLYEEVEADRNTLQQILEVTGSILTAPPEEDIFESLLHQLGLLFGASRASLMLPEPSGELLRVVSTTDLPQLRDLKLSAWKYPEVQKAIQMREVVLVQDVRADAMMAPVAAELEQAHVRSLLVLPLLAEQGLRGVLLLRRTVEQDGFSEREGWLCRLITQAVASLVRSHDLHRELERNVHQLQETRDRLLQSERLSSLGQFVAGIAHELNNPLTGIISFSSLLLRSHQSAFVRQSLGRINQEAERCRRVVRNLLTFSRTHGSDKEPVSLNSIVSQALESRRNSLDTARIRLVADLDPALPPILGDAHQLEQVLLNLVDNALAALAHASEAPCLSLSTRRHGDEVHLVLSDNGPGMRREVRERIFEPFFTTKASGSGTGLGMSIVKGIVEDHGGSIEVDSEPGQGASFLLSWPVYIGGTVRREEPAEPEEEPVLQGHGSRILLIDDEPAIVEALSNFLRLQGFEVQSAMTANQAIELCSQCSFDAVLLDLRLPDVPGRELYQRLVQLCPKLGSHFVFISGDGLGNDMRPFLAQRGEGFLAKPFTFDELMGSLGRALKVRETV